MTARLVGAGARDRIFVLDEAEPILGAVEAYREACLGDYRMESEGRGMRLDAAWITPPVISLHGGNRLFFLWSFDNLDAFWNARFLALEEKAEWWRRTAPLVHKRSRSILSAVEVRNSHASDAD